MKARVSNLYKTEAEWNDIDFTPYAGELVVYAPDYKEYSYARIKIGDGKTQLKLLPFLAEAAIRDKLLEYDMAAVADAGSITSYFN